VIALPKLDWDELWFPPVEQALNEPNGLLAFGGDLRPERLLLAYENGIFPWYQDDQPILWWSPDPRGVLFPDQIHISRSMRKVLTSDRFTVRMDTAFVDVVRGCAELTPKRNGTWITPAMQRAYHELHLLGHAHSIEIWDGEQLVGGLYGVAHGAVFFGESMFSRVQNASKVALIRLCQQLREWGFAMIDCQLGSDHLDTMGARVIPRSEFLDLLKKHSKRKLSVNGSLWQFTGNG
jgi:leucyl/phenylalanyl-tRNA---protein transferase